MEDPVKEISSVIHTLTQAPPIQQRNCIETYFTPTASFTHPFCRTGSFGPEYLPRFKNASFPSRWFILQIYQWYKILSPQIILDVESIAFDAEHLLLYVTISQIFKIQWIPFHKSSVRLTTVLKLVEDSARMTEIKQYNEKQEQKLIKSDYASVREPHKRYLIQSQNDLYQTSEFVKFIFFLGGDTVIMILQYLATLACVLGAFLLWPVTFLSQDAYERKHGLSKATNGWAKQLESDAKTQLNTMAETAKKLATRVTAAKRPAGGSDSGNGGSESSKSTE